LLPLLAYIPAMNGGYLWDDDHYITLNKDLRDTAGLARIWTRLGRANGGAPQYYPLTHTTFWIQYQLHGLWSFPYHFVNVLLHALCAVLAWRILLQLKVPGAWLAAAIWAIHPVNVESVAWMTERKNVLSGAFFFLAILAYLKAVREEGWKMDDGEWRMEKTIPRHPPSSILHLPSSSYLLSLLFFLLALLSKTTVSLLPVVLFLILWWKKALNRRHILGLLPFLIIGIPLGLVTAYVERRYVGAIGPDWDFSFVQRILIGGRSVWFYLAKLAWPAHLSFSYHRWVIDASNARQWLYPLAALGMVVAALPRPGIRTGVLSFLVLLFPAMGFFNIYPMRFSFVADHFQYLASLSMIALIVALCSRRLTARLRQISAVLILLALFLTTWNRSGAIPSPATLRRGWREIIWEWR
jgi:hypothetical protein